MHPALATLLGVIEGLTEYLPVSSTGHLVLTEHAFELALRNGGLLGPNPLKTEGAKSFDIVIQLGAILAVLVHYRALLGARLLGLFRLEKQSVALLTALVVGFLPTAVTGLLLRKIIKKFLFHPTPIAVALVLGGVLMIVVERARRARNVTGLTGLEHVTPRRAFLIGLGQCVSMIPGSSRSMCTILAGQASGLSTATAAEFSFLLGLPTLGAATLYEAYKSHDALFAEVGAPSIVIGLSVSFFVAWAVVALFIRYLQKRGLEPFGYYRIALGAVVLVTLYA